MLDVGSNAGYDPFMFKLLGAGEVMACEPFDFFNQMEFLEGIYQTGIQRSGSAGRTSLPSSTAPSISCTVTGCSTTRCTRSPCCSACDRC